MIPEGRIGRRGSQARRAADPLESEAHPNPRDVRDRNSRFTMVRIMCASRVRIYIAVAVLISALASIPKAAELPLRLHPDNPHYFVYQGRPTVLITSGEHYGAVLNLAFDYIRDEFRHGADDPVRRARSSNGNPRRITVIHCSPGASAVGSDSPAAFRTIRCLA